MRIQSIQLPTPSIKLQGVLRFYVQQASATCLREKKQVSLCETGFAAVRHQSYHVMFPKKTRVLELQISHTGSRCVQVWFCGVIFLGYNMYALANPMCVVSFGTATGSNFCTHQRPSAESRKRHGSGIQTATSTLWILATARIPSAGPTSKCYSEPVF